MSAKKTEPTSVQDTPVQELDTKTPEVAEAAENTRLAKELLEMEELVAAYKAKLTELTTSGQNVEPDVEPYYDPFFAQDPYEVNGMIPPCDTFPQGQMLCWLNPIQRERTGYKGWIVMEYGDRYTGENGEKLREYGIPDPPMIMEGSQRLDSKVRRGDVVLGRLDARIHETRMRRNNEKSDVRRETLGAVNENSLRPGVTYIGHGRQLDSAPPGKGFHINMVEAPEKGTIQRRVIPRED